MSSTYLVSTYTPQQGSLLRRLRPFTSQRIGLAIPFPVKVNPISSALKSSDSHSRTTIFSHNLDKSILKNTTSILKSKHTCSATVVEHENNAVNNFIWFFRPYAIVSLVMTILSTCTLPLQSMADLTPTYFFAVLKAVTTMVLIFVYNVSINQVFDIELDKINKSYLPLVSGAYSMKFAVGLTILSSALSILMGLMESPALLGSVLTIFLFAGAYSIDLPFLRWKKNGILSIVTVVAWGLGLQTGIFLHIQKYVLGKPVVFTRSVIFAITYQCLFSFVDAMIKDLPDVDGDKANGCRNMAILFGKEKVLWTGTAIMLATYVGAVFLGASSPYLIPKIITVLGHSTIAVLIWLRARKVDLTNDESTKSFHQFMWSISGFESFLIPLIR